MRPIDLVIERDRLRERGVDIIVMPTRCGHHSFKRRYTFEVYYRTKDGKLDNEEPSRPTGSWETYNEALESAINTANDVLEKAKNFGITI